MLGTSKTARPRSFIRVKPFASRLGISPSTLWRWIRDGRLKPPLAFNDRIKGYEEAYVDQILDRLAAEAEEDDAA